MSSRLLFALLCIASIASGCIVTHNDEDGCTSCRPPPAQPGDVTFLWTFGGRHCSQAQDVYGVNITIPGEQLLNNGNYACNTAGVDGITLHDFAPGSYPYTLQGVDFQGHILFQASGTFSIDGNRTVPVDLTPTESPGSYAYLSWTFPGNVSCTHAGVSSVDVLLDGLAPHNVPCTQGQTAPGLQTPYLAPGGHSIEFIARDASGRPRYTYQGALTTQAYNPVSATYNLNALPPQPGNVSFLWTFDGRRCDQARDVYGVNITIPGEVLINNGQFACSTSGIDGITLHDFLPGTYSFKLQGVNFQGQVIFEATGTFTIDGDRTVLVDLAPTGSPGSYAYLSWTFPGNASCAQVGVASVDITLDDLSSHNVPCTQGQTTPGVQTPYLAPGDHYIEFVAKDSSGQPLYYYNGGLTTQAYNPVSASYSLYTIGGASISWLLSDGAVTFDCPQANPKVYVNFQDRTTGNWVYPGAGDGHDCSTKPIIYQFLRPGSYNLRVSTTTGGYNYLSNSNIVLQVQSHVFPGPSQALQVTLYRQ